MKKTERWLHDEHALEQPDEVAVDAEFIGRQMEVLTAARIPLVDAAGNDSVMYSKQWLPAVFTKIPDGKDTILSANKKKMKVKVKAAGSFSNLTTTSATGLGCSSPSSTVGP